MNFVIFFITIVISILVPGVVNVDGDWGYRDGSFLSPSQWKNKYKSCGGYRQTPIDINRSTVHYWSTLKPVSTSTPQNPSNVEFKKGSMTIYLSFSGKWQISFGGGECYRPYHIHWHWGSVDTRGSEHTIDNSMYPIEGHLVTYNCNLYSTFEEAASSPSGLHVFGMLYKVGSRNEALSLLTDYFRIVKLNGSLNVQEIRPSMFLPQNVAQYFRYEGSLTTPPCTENVIWTVFNEVQTLDSDQLNMFRTLLYDKPESGNMVDNYRPVIPVVDSSDYVKRVVYASFKGARGLSYRAILMTLPLLTTVLSWAH